MIIASNLSRYDAYKKYSILVRHRLTGNESWISVSGIEKSERKLRDKIDNNKSKFSYFLTFTFSAKEKVIHTRKGWENHISYYKRYNLKNLVTGELMRGIINTFKNTYYKFSYLWKYEEGRKNGRSHFHMMCDLKNARDVHKLFRLWKYGMRKRETINNQYGLDFYLKKYFSKKERPLKLLKKRCRRFGSSRDIKSPVKLMFTEGTYLTNYDPVLHPKKTIMVCKKTKKGIVYKEIKIKTEFERAISIENAESEAYFINELKTNYDFMFKKDPKLLNTWINNRIKEKQNEILKNKNLNVECELVDTMGQAVHFGTHFQESQL